MPTHTLARRLLAGLTVFVLLFGLLGWQAGPALARPAFALSDSLAAYWDLDEASGTRDDSIASSDLADNNTVTSATGKVGDAAQFVLANDEYLSVSDNAAVSTGNVDFSLAGWVYLDSKTDYLIFLRKWDIIPTAANNEYQLYYDPSADRFVFGVSADGTNPGGVSVTANNFGAPSLSTWYFIVAWHDAAGNTINIQVNNGTANSAAHSGGVFDGNRPLTLSAPSSTSGTVDGRMDEWGIWKKVLSADEKGYLYDGAAGCTYPFTDCEPPPPTPTATSTATASATLTASPTPTSTATPGPTATATATPPIAFSSASVTTVDQKNFWFWLLGGMFSLIEAFMQRLPGYTNVGMAVLFYNALLGVLTVFALYFGTFLNLCWFVTLFVIFLTSEGARGLMAMYRTVVKLIPMP